MCIAYKVGTNKHSTCPGSSRTYKVSAAKVKGDAAMEGKRKGHASGQAVRALPLEQPPVTLDTQPPDSGMRAHWKQESRCPPGELGVGGGGVNKPHNPGAGLAGI